MPEAGTDRATNGVASEIRKKILVRFRILVEQNPDFPLGILATRAGSIGDVSGDTVLHWARKDAPATVRRGPTDDEILDAVLEYERLCRDEPGELRHELANRAGYPIGLTGSQITGWAYRLGVKLPPAPNDPFRGRFAGGGPGLTPIRRQAAERYLSLVEQYPQAARKTHAFAVADECGLTRESVQDAARMLQAERSGPGGTSDKAKTRAEVRGRAVEAYLTRIEGCLRGVRKRHAYAVAEQFGLTVNSLRAAVQRHRAEGRRAGADAPEKISGHGALTLVAGRR